jgi:hypothetical protein
MTDGVHTFKELYEFRMLYHAHAVRSWMEQGINVVRSWRHHDGDECFGGGWFIVVAELSTGQVSNHYRSPQWPVFAGVPEVATAPEWDGHSVEDVLRRLRAALSGAKRLPPRRYEP